MHIYKLNTHTHTIGHLPLNPEYALTKQIKIKDERNKYVPFVIYGDTF